MDDREEVIAALQGELQEFFAWIVSEAGVDYYVDDRENASESVDDAARKSVLRRIQGNRLGLWERDWHAFYQDPHHPSIYEMLKAEDLEVVHYLEEFACEHFKALDAAGPTEDGGPGLERRFEQSFGVLLASQTLGWMYRLDFCELCGLIEVWSMQYSPDEISYCLGG